jgi:DNA-directed RNA polymerase specialized sigma24 family protein
MTTNALERLREKKRSAQKLTPLENVVWGALWTNDPDAFEAAEEFESKADAIEKFRRFMAHVTPPLRSRFPDEFQRYVEAKAALAALNIESEKE